MALRHSGYLPFWSSSSGRPPLARGFSGRSAASMMCILGRGKQGWPLLQGTWPPVLCTRSANYGRADYPERRSGWRLRMVSFPVCSLLATFSLRLAGKFPKPPAAGVVSSAVFFALRSRSGSFASFEVERRTIVEYGPLLTYTPFGTLAYLCMR
jgi:hypothetical protein